MAKPTLLTNGVRITCKHWYSADYSNPLADEYMHAYEITVENNNPFPVRLLSRKWIITNADGKCEQLRGRA